MAKSNNDATYILNSKSALSNKLLQADGTITDLAGRQVINPVDTYKSKPALPNKFLNPDGTYSTLNEIIASMVDTNIFVVVEELPASGDEQKIYLVPDGKGGLVEYHWTGDKWDPIGTVNIDLSNYSTTQEMMNAIEASALATLNAAKAYTDEHSSSTNPQVYYWDGKTDQSGLDFWNNIYQVQKIQPCIVTHIHMINGAYTTFTWYYYNNMPTLAHTTSFGNIRSFNFRGYEESSGYNVFGIYLADLSFTVTDDTVIKIQYGVNSYSLNYLDTNKKMNIVYTPLYNNSPATKKYVDDSIADSITNVLGGEY